MSSDTAKENASVVDSSVTEKHDMGNSDDPESSSYKANEDGYPSLTEKGKAGHFDGRLENSTENRKDKLYNTRYFIIKSLNHHNIQLSIEKGIWATQVMNEPVLEEAFHNSAKVILVYSVNMSGFFQGYAQMMSSVRWRRDNIWSRGYGKSNPWGRSFKVKWLQLNNLPFQKTLHLKNPLNDYKPVKISRDCQELPYDIGAALCDLIDGKGDVDGMPTRDDLLAKRPCIEPSSSMTDDEYHMPPLHMSLARTPMPYPSFLYQHQAGACNFYLAQRSERNLQVDSDISARYDFWGLSAESPLASTMTEDDFLEMSYEEYLEVHSRSIKQLCLPKYCIFGMSYRFELDDQVGGPSWTMPESSSKKQDDDSTSSFVADKRHLQKRAHHSSQK